MAQLTDSQKQILDEMQALFKAWVDRGVTARDALPLFVTYACMAGIQGNFPLSTVMEMVPRVWAQTMLRMVEAKIAQPIPEPPITPPSKL